MPGPAGWTRGPESQVLLLVAALAKQVGGGVAPARVICDPHTSGRETTAIASWAFALYMTLSYILTRDQDEWEDM